MNLENEFGKFINNKYPEITNEDLSSYDAALSEKMNSVGTPMILEEREMRGTALSVFDRLMMDRIIWVSGPVDGRMASIIQAQLLFLESVDPKKEIKMYIDTPGGCVKSGLGIVDVMEFVKPDIRTINTGMAASMGSVLLSHGTKGKRGSLVNSLFMVHQVSSGVQGHVKDQLISFEEAAKYNYILMRRLADKSTKYSFDEILDNHERDVWYNSDQCLAAGWIDEIHKSEGTKSITEWMDGYQDYRERLRKDLERR